ncbi:MAG: 6-carboxytetrahydropterin synthase QueD [Thermodesulfobacteriota bacterium]
MYEITIETGFSAAHNLREYEGACERLHGHNWKVAVHVSSDSLDSLGMVVDFRVLRKEAAKVMERFDHRYLNEVPPFDTINPSAENIAKYVFDELSGVLNDGNVRVSLIRVWESAHAAAAYRG